MRDSKHLESTLFREPSSRNFGIGRAAPAGRPLRGRALQGCVRIAGSVVGRWRVRPRSGRQLPSPAQPAGRSARLGLFRMDSPRASGLGCRENARVLPPLSRTRVRVHAVVRPDFWRREFVRDVRQLSRIRVQAFRPGRAGPGRVSLDRRSSGRSAPNRPTRLAPVSGTSSRRPRPRGRRRRPGPRARLRKPSTRGTNQYPALRRASRPRPTRPRRRSRRNPTRKEADQASRATART